MQAKEWQQTNEGQNKFAGIQEWLREKLSLRIVKVRDEGERRAKYG